MTKTIEVEVSSLAAAAHNELTQFDEYEEIVSDNLEEFVLQMYRDAERQASELEAEQ